MDPAKEIKRILKHYKAESAFLQDELTKLCHDFAAYRIKNYSDAVEAFGDKLEKIKESDPLTGNKDKL